MKLPVTGEWAPTPAWCAGEAKGAPMLAVAVTVAQVFPPTNKDAVLCPLAAGRWAYGKYGEYG